MKCARPVSTPNDLERRLLTYAVTAGAALAATAQDAAAAPITYTVNLPIPVNTPVFLDIDQNGDDDFAFVNISDVTVGLLAGIGNGQNAFFGIPKDEVSGKTKGFGFAFPNGSYQWGGGANIGDPFGLVNVAIVGLATDAQGGLLADDSLTAFLPNLYFPLPVSFDSGGDTLYGWVRIKAEFVGPYTLNASILDVGYSSELGEPSHLPDPVPEPGTLGLLALGAAGLALRRRLARSN